MDRNRAILFIDGSNWYHALKENGVTDTIRLDYAKISEKLVMDREWVETRYYGVQLDQESNPELYAKNRRFLSLLDNDDEKISVPLGRIEARSESNPLAEELAEFIRSHRDLPPEAGRKLVELAREYQEETRYKEKGVDVQLAIDMVRLAMEKRYDTAYLLSADGDFTPAVDTVTEMGKTVFAACPNFGSALNEHCKTFLPLRSDWFDDCFRE